MSIPISAAKIRKKNDTRKSACHFFAFYVDFFRIYSEHRVGYHPTDPVR